MSPEQYDAYRTMLWGEILQLVQKEGPLVDEMDKVLIGRDESTIPEGTRESLVAHMQGVEGKAATWDEWGIFIAALFKFDPEAKIGWYKSYDHFIEFTTEERDRCAQYRPDLGRTAPWLDDEKKGNYA